MILRRLLLTKFLNELISFCGTLEKVKNQLKQNKLEEQLIFNNKDLFMSGK